MKKALLDTNIVSAFFKGNADVVRMVEKYLDKHGSLSISIITYYELLRGLKVLANDKKLKAFHDFVELCEVEEIGRSVVEKAAEIYVDLRAQGKLIEDADILIAATAMERGMAVVSDNVGYFKRIKGLKLENWIR